VRSLSELEAARLAANEAFNYADQLKTQAANLEDQAHALRDTAARCAAWAEEAAKLEAGARPVS
jgi:hypothetical protein